MRLPRAKRKYPRSVPERVMDDGTIIHGVPYNKLPDDIKSDLDERPCNDDGRWRIFLPDSFYPGKFIEFGSSSNLRNELEEKARKWNL